MDKTNSVSVEIYWGWRSRFLFGVGVVEGGKKWILCFYPFEIAVDFGRIYG